MSENNNNSVDIEEIVSDEEYKEALEKLNTPKSERRRKALAAKKAKEEAKVKLTREDFKALSFMGKCRRDPVIPVCLILAFIALVGAAIYYILPYAVIGSFGMTIDEFRSRYESTDTYQNLFANYSLAIPEVTYEDASATETTETTQASSAQGDGTTTDAAVSNPVNENARFLNYFTCYIDSDFGTSIQGSTRKSDGELTALRVYAPYSGDNTQFIMYYFASFLETFYPDLTYETASDLASDMFTNFDNKGLFTVRGDYAYRLVFLQSDGISSLAFDIVPKRNIDSSLIAAATADSSDASATSASEETAATDTTSLSEETTAAT
ncbi:MAG: hypothetical protein LKG26_02250 [Saccharofermentans sp.]|jgi:hypothetical protein|nr:hypothetical protein [Mageeibacillus sp.]MCI1263457.1 hypothetical protein [Saccharofermentans sp.]MCI1274895.1 hypothetical protein [Saccharofermentans sp.]MCI2043992.1 hypothetical protein [Mageeibacillus sp.]